MTETFEINLEELARQAKASVMIQTLLDFWESGHEEVPGLTREFVQETIEYAAGVDDGVKDTIVAGYEFYAGGQQQLLESILGNHSRQSRQNIIRFLPDDAPKQVIGELDDLVYLLPLVKLTFDDFFAEGNEETLYIRGHNLGTPYSVEAILNRYSSQEHQMVPFGTAGRIHSRLRKMQEDEKKKAVEELLRKTGYTEIFKEYSQSRIYFFSDEVALVKSVFDGFFKEGNRGVPYSCTRNLGMPFSVEAILRRYSMQEHRMLEPSTAQKLSLRLRRISDAEKTAAIIGLLEKTGYTEIFEQYLQSNRNNPFVPPPVETQQPCTAPRTP